MRCARSSPASAWSWRGPSTATADRRNPGIANSRSSWRVARADGSPISALGTQTKPKWEGTVRSGGSALTLLATPLNGCILQALARPPASLAELRQAAGGPPQTTVRNHLAALSEIGIVAKERTDSGI